MPEINVERKQFWFLHHSNRRHRQFACHKMEIRQHYRKDTYRLQQNVPVVGDNRAVDFNFEIMVSAIKIIDVRGTGYLQIE
jgi:hypothetical protein